MEVENKVLEDVWLVSKWAIFHFHDYGRKGNVFGPAILGDPPGNVTYPIWGKPENHRLKSAGKR